jgi:hypothetical protein
LNDSPARLAAWILEKFREWSDRGGDLYQILSPDELLANVTLYWLTEIIGSSFRMYLESRRSPLQFERGEFVQPPCTIAHFPKEILFPPKEWNGLQRSTLDGDAPRRPRCGHGTASTLGRGYSDILSQISQLMRL